MSICDDIRFIDKLIYSSLHITEQHLAFRYANSIATTYVVTNPNSPRIPYAEYRKMIEEITVQLLVNVGADARSQWEQTLYAYSTGSMYFISKCAQTHVVKLMTTTMWETLKQKGNAPKELWQDYIIPFIKNVISQQVVPKSNH